MVSDDALRFVSEVFIGDTENCYSYKSGGQLVDFFNTYFGFQDSYRPGFPSRWRYVLDNLKILMNNGKVNEFFTLVLDKRFLMRDSRITEAKALETKVKVLNLLNEQLQYEGFQLIEKGKQIVFVNQDDDEQIGEGGFARVYFRQGTDRVIKKLKDEYVLSQGIRSRFRREFEITKSLQDIHGIIKVYNFHEDTFSYEMEKGGDTLAQFILKHDISKKEKFKLIFELVKIIGTVHARNIIHRDLSPTNVLFVNGNMKITDFGLGKDYETVHSHRTIHTNAYGQFDYCSPEQLYALKEGDKRSDVFSLGRVINFILTTNPTNERHDFAQIVSKATTRNREDRYESAIDMLEAIKGMLKIIQNRNLKEIASKDIQNGELTTEVVQFINSLSDEELCNQLIMNPLFSNTLVNYMKQTESNENYVIDGVKNNFGDVCATFESNDPIASFALSVLQDNFSFITKEKAARMLSYIAYSVNRFSSQRMIDSLVNLGIDPLLEEILKG